MEVYSFSSEKDNRSGGKSSVFGRLTLKRRRRSSCKKSKYRRALFAETCKVLYDWSQSYSNKYCISSTIYSVSNVFGGWVDKNLGI
jgi:hypothetical protein